MPRNPKASRRNSMALYRAVVDSTHEANRIADWLRESSRLRWRGFKANLIRLHLGRNNSTILPKSSGWSRTLKATLLLDLPNFVCRLLFRSTLMRLTFSKLDFSERSLIVTVSLLGFYKGIRNIFFSLLATEENINTNVF